MLPWILIILGVLLIVISLLGFVAIIISPIFSDFRVVFRREDDDLKYETPLGKYVLHKKKRRVTTYFAVLLAVGVICFCLGMMLGRSERGDNFLPYKLLYGSEPALEDLSDKIDENGRYIGDDQNKYSYYVRIQGDTVSLNNVVYEDFEEFRKFVQSLNRDNTILLLDDYAVAETYNQVRDFLKIHFEIVEEKN